MPANLTPQYEKAEQRYREAASDEDRLAALREMLSTIPKHKGTEKLQADIKRRISQLRKAEGKRGPGRTVDPFHVPRGGAGQVVLVGPPNVGKSMLLSVTTNAPARVGDYPYTTALPQPGMWNYEDVRIELVDTPPVAADHVPPGLWNTIRSADVVCVVVDAADTPLAQAEMVLDLLAARRIELRSAPRTELASPDGGQYSGLLLANKADLAAAGDIQALRELYRGRLDVLAVSAVSGEGLDALLKRLWALLSIIRVYTKQPGRPPDHARPFTLQAGSTVEDLAREIHRELPEKMKFARVWGDGRYSGQQVHRTEELRDKDVVEIRE